MDCDMEQCFEWLSQPSNEGKLIDQKILTLLISASRQKFDDFPRMLEICQLLLSRLLREVITENALSTGLALCSALMSSGLQSVPEIVCRLLRREILESPECWFVGPTEAGRPQDENVTRVPVSDIFLLGICHGTVNTALYKSFSQAELSQLIQTLLPLCKKPSRLTTTSIRLLTLTVTQFRKLPLERLSSFGDSILPIVRYGWNGPANSPKEIRRLAETVLLSEGYNHAQMTKEMIELPWGSRTKLLAFSALWSTCSREKVLQCHANLSEKLASCLSDPRLVSAGTDAYLAFLGHVQDAEDWWSFFSGLLLPLLLSHSDWAATRALFTHWLPPALKRFPPLYYKLMDAIPGDDGVQLCSLVLLHNEASKIFSVPVSDNADAVSHGLRHKNETVRLAAFSFICRGFTPQLQGAVTSFLTENVTCDSAPLRQGIVSCVRTLLLHLIKIAHSSVSGESPTFFLRWLHTFLTENLTIGVGNYQRRLLSLQLFGCVLGVAEKCAGFHQVAPEGMWSTKSEENCNLLLCVLVSDPAKNIRQEAAKILAHHFSPDDPHLRCRLAAHGIDTCRSGWFFRAEVALEIFDLVSAWLGGCSICYSCLQDEGVFGSESVSLTKSKVQVENCDCVELCSAMGALRSMDAEESKDQRTSEHRHVLGCPAKALTQTVSQIENLFSSLFYSGEIILEGEIEQSYFPNCKCPEMCRRVDKPAVDSTQGHVPLIMLLLWEAQTQWLHLQGDPVNAAVQGNAVHGVLAALTSVAVDHFSPGQVQAALMLLEDVVDWVLRVLASQSSGLSPSFADMGVALSSLADNVESDEQLLHLSPAFQTALNCLWLNLKACCDVAAHLLSSRRCDGDAAVRFLRVIASVLTQCRHKGAIEAAGRALSVSVKVATSVKCGRVTRTGVLLRDVPGILLAAILDQLRNSETTVSLTRRSAGVAILVHRIVIGDGAYGHPLLDLAVRRLLALAAEPVNPKQPANVDSPQAQAIHCLTAIVRESSLRTQVSTYVGEVTLLCLDRLVNESNWNVRNAGLQLYSAVVPRLTDGLSSLDAVAWRYPELGAYLLNHRLQEEDVSTLTLLARLCCDADSVPQQLLRRLQALLSESRSRQVRLLAAEALASGSSLKAVERLVGDADSDDWNGLHGRLVCLELLMRRMAALEVPVPGCVRTLRIPARCPWPCREVFDRLRASRDVSEDLRELLHALRQGQHLHAPGFFPWADARARHVINSCEDLSLLGVELRPLLTGAGLEARCLDVCSSALQALRSRVSRRPPPPEAAATLLEVLLEALSAGPRSPDTELRQLEAAQTLEAPVGPHHEPLLEDLADRHAAALPLLARVSLASRRRPELLRRCARLVKTHGLRRDADDDRREYAAVALATLLPSLGPDDGDVVEELLDATATLQEDDVAEVRDAVGASPPLSVVLGPRRAAQLLWRRLADVSGALEACEGRLSPFGQENDALREEPCRTAALTCDALVAILAENPEAFKPDLDLGTLSDAVVRVLTAHRDKGTYLTITAARLVSVKLGLLCDALSLTGGGRDVCEALRSLREKVEGCLTRLTP